MHACARARRSRLQAFLVLSPLSRLERNGPPAWRRRRRTRRPRDGASRSSAASTSAGSTSPTTVGSIVNSRVDLVSPSICGRISLTLVRCCGWLWLCASTADADGRLTGKDALKFFAMSKLSRDDLKQVKDSCAFHSMFFMHNYLYCVVFVPGKNICFFTPLNFHHKKSVPLLPTHFPPLDLHSSGLGNC